MAIQPEDLKFIRDAMSQLRVVMRTPVICECETPLLDIGEHGEVICFECACPVEAATARLGVPPDGTIPEDDDPLDSIVAKP